VTELLLACRAGGGEALDRLFPVLYDRLHDIAHAHLGVGRGSPTVSTTALVHEAYVKLVDAQRVEWQDREHFLSLASRAMRQILIDYARRHAAAKRGGDLQRIDLDAAQIAVLERAGIGGRAIDIGSCVQAVEPDVYETPSSCRRDRPERREGRLHRSL
jgi:RNA polymerase sigma factor (TIGR02999 family)